MLLFQPPGANHHSLDTRGHKTHPVSLYSLVWGIGNSEPGPGLGRAPTRMPRVVWASSQHGGCRALPFSGAWHLSRCPWAGPRCPAV